MNTPVSKCGDLAAYAARMLGKFTNQATLLALGLEMTAAAAELHAAQAVYEQAVRDILPARVDVKYENYVSDRRIRVTQQKAEMADGKRGGRIAAIAFPEGSAPITRLVGASQVQAMVDLEGRLAAAQALWPDASAEKEAIAQHREHYDNALIARKNAGQHARNMRAARNAAKDKFIHKYVEIMSRVEAEFPKDRATQDLFFDEVRTKSALATADTSTGEEGDDEGNESETTGG
ncbi:hypothetical protein [Polyangium jinanense]|uniref:Uncharacterized protein n=1 Tax=Polyangium jinanense TaxID=2829994 RepID=A0A9X3X6W7_9BACT|nr:hypothetical protein [Polyangium jinanense]MDC3985014.1 hypothetical protein [Polyangium jinanense]